MVQQAMQYIDETPDVESKVELIKALNSVSAGKVNVLSWDQRYLLLDRLYEVYLSLPFFPKLLSMLHCRYMLR